MAAPTRAAYRSLATEREDLSWIAPRSGQDRRDDSVLLAHAWLTSLVEQEAWQRRVEAIAFYLAKAKTCWLAGDPAAIYGPVDAAGWYMFQVRAVVIDRLLGNRVDCESLC